MIRTTFTLSTAALFLVVATTASCQSLERRSALHDYRIVPVVSDLEHPWSIVFLPGGDMLVTERPGRLRIVRDGVLVPEPVGELEDGPLFLVRHRPELSIPGAGLRYCRVVRFSSRFRNASTSAANVSASTDTL